MLLRSLEISWDLKSGAISLVILVVVYQESWPNLVKIKLTILNAHWACAFAAWSAQQGYWDTGDLKNIIKYHKKTFIVDLPIKEWWFSNSFLYVYQRAIQYIIKYQKKTTLPTRSGVDHPESNKHHAFLAVQLLGSLLPFFHTGMFFRTIMPRVECQRRKRTMIQWIGLRENLQENPIFNGKIYGFLWIFP